MPKPGGRIDAVVVCGGKYHDFDFARREVLGELRRFDRVKSRVFEDFACAEPDGPLGGADLLVTYTCDVRPTLEQQRGLREFVAGGGRWLALHGTNSALDAPEHLGQGVPFRAPRAFPLMADVLGSQFLAHPAMEPYRVEVTDADHPLVEGIGSFEVEDELYCSELHGPIEVLLHTRFTGSCPGFEDDEWPDDDVRPVLYLKRTGDGTVCYFTLGHCRGPLDMQDFVPEYPRVERGSWDRPEFRAVLGRCLQWAVTGSLPAADREVHHAAT
jgi:type 1 glutamine amidotransferase